jgi:hypothetical protein
LRRKKRKKKRKEKKKQKANERRGWVRTEDLGRRRRRLRLG